MKEEDSRPLVSTQKLVQVTTALLETEARELHHAEHWRAIKSTRMKDKAINTEKAEEVKSTIAEDKVLMEEEALTFKSKRRKKIQTQIDADLRPSRRQRRRLSKTMGATKKRLYTGNNGCRKTYKIQRINSTAVISGGTSRLIVREENQCVHCASSTIITWSAQSKEEDISRRCTETARLITLQSCLAPPITWKGRSEKHDQHSVRQIKLPPQLMDKYLRRRQLR